MEHSITIPLASRTQPGHVALIDAEDEELVAGYHWILKAYGTCKYAFAWIPNKPRNKRLHLHRLIMSAPDGMLVDHINGDGLDCRRQNLRFATQAENLRNKRKKSNAIHTPYKGLWRRPTKTGVRWAARIYVDNTYRLLGTYDTDVEAARAYDEAAKKFFGEFARLNFPD